MSKMKLSDIAQAINQKGRPLLENMESTQQMFEERIRTLREQRNKLAAIEAEAIRQRNEQAAAAAKGQEADAAQADASGDAAAQQAAPAAPIEPVQTVQTTVVAPSEFIRSAAQPKYNKPRQQAPGQPRPAQGGAQQKNRPQGAQAQGCPQVQQRTDAARGPARTPHGNGQAPARQPRPNGAQGTRDFAPRGDRGDYAQRQQRNFNGGANAQGGPQRRNDGQRPQQQRAAGGPAAAGRRPAPRAGATPLVPPVEKERVSNYDPNRSAYNKNSNGDKKPKNKKQIMKETLASKRGSDDRVYGPRKRKPKRQEPKTYIEAI